jgi:Holliday junction resolvase RusA-like endonuclease
MTIIIPIKPIAKGRPRFSNGHTYTPQRTIDYEDEISRYLEQAAIENDWICDDAPMTIKITFRFKNKKTDYHTSRPDLDNLYKAITDAGNGILYNDDSQIFDARMIKLKSNVDQVEIEVYAEAWE